jgi:hypothetical protein
VCVSTATITPDEKKGDYRCGSEMLTIAEPALRHSTRRRTVS